MRLSCKLLQSAAIQRYLPDSSCCLARLGSSFHPGSLFGWRSHSEVIENYNFDLLRRALVSCITHALFCGVSLKAFSHRAPLWQEEFPAELKCHSTFRRRGFSGISAILSYFLDPFFAS